MSELSIREELLNATGVTEKKKEEPQALYHRIIDAVQELEDEQWEGLSEEAQEWVNKGSSKVEADGEDAVIAGFPDEDDEEQGDDAGEGGEETDDDEQQEESVSTTKKASTKGTKKAPTKKEAASKKSATPKEAKTPKERKASPPKATGIKVQIKKMVLKKPSITNDEIMENLSKGGTTPSKLTVSAIRSEFRHSLFVIKDAGFLSDSVKLD